MRAVAGSVVVGLLASFVVVSLGSSSAVAATTLFVSDETTLTGLAGSAQAESFRNGSGWTAAVNAAYPGATFETSVIAAAANPFPTGPFFTSSSGSTVSVETRLFDDALIGDTSQVGTVTGATQGATSCTANGTQGQGGSPRPTSLRYIPAAAGCPTTSARGFAFTQNPLGSAAGLRSGLVFTFSSPVAAFGAWFQDIETKTTGLGRPALLRTYDGSGVFIAQTVVGPGATNEALCGAGPNGNNVVAACGNETTRWMGFTATGSQLVGSMILIVGDDDTGTTGGNQNDGRDEGLGFIGATMVTYPQLTATKVLASGYPINLGTGQYEVRYDLSVTNTGGTALTAVGLVEDLAATFAPLPAASISVQSVSVTGTVAANPSFNGTTVTQLLDTAASTLAVGATFTASVTVRVTPGSALGPYNNSVTASGTAGTTTVSDTNDLPVPVTFTESPALTASKAVTGVTSNGDGSQSVEFSVVVTNTGNVVLRDLTVIDPLATAFVSQFLSTTVPVVSAVGPGSSITANPSFNGGADPQLIALPSVLAAGESFTITFTARIVAASSAPGVNAITASATSPAGAPVTAAGTAPVNLPFTGSLRIDKVVTGTPLTANSTFPFDVNCGAAGSFPSSVTIGPGDSSGSTTIPSIPALASCTVTEGVLPPPPAGYFWSGTTVSPSVSSIVDGTVTTATVTNRLTQSLGTLRIRLDVSDGPSSGITGNVVFQAACGSSGTFPAILSFAGNRSATASVPNIPVPTTCVITKTSRPPAPAGFAWSTLSIPPITTAVTTTPVTVTAITALVPRSVIATTGNDPTGIIAIVFVMLVLGTAFLVIARVNRRRRIDRS